MGAAVMGIIAVAWLAYLLPWYLKNRGHTVDATDDAVDQFANSMVIVRHGSPEELDDQVLDELSVEISTPLLRSAAREDIAIQARTAVRRRRVGLVISLVVLVAGAVVWPTLSLPWWVACVGPMMLICWSVVSHASVGIINRRLDRGLQLLAQGWDEQTAVIGAPEMSSVRARVREENEHSVDLSKPLDPGTNLPDPLPVTPLTYVNTPPRSYRPIDLSAPVPRPTTPAFPVTSAFSQDALPFGERVQIEQRTVDGDETTSHVVGE
jgi:hypothetical protein